MAVNYKNPVLNDEREASPDFQRFVRAGSATTALFSVMGGRTLSCFCMSGDWKPELIQLVHHGYGNAMTANTQWVEWIPLTHMIIPSLLPIKKSMAQGKHFSPTTR